MTITDMIKKKPSSHQSSFNDDTHKQNKKFKQLHMSVLDLLHWHRPKDSPEIKTIEDEFPQGSNKRRPSIIKSSDMSRALSKKSVTFASVFDLEDDDEHYVKYDLETNIQNEITSEEEEEDLINVFSTEPINNESKTESSEIPEPYPFRSEIPLSQSPRSDSSINDTKTSHHSRRKLINHFIHHRRPKKLRHPIKSINPVSTMNRSTSVPDILFSSPPPPTTVKINKQQQQQQQQPLKTIRTWFKSSKLGRFVQSFSKHPQQNQNIISKASHQSKDLTTPSDFIY